VLVVASFVSQLPAGIGAAAAGMAVFGFLFQAGPALRQRPEKELRQKVAIGGLVGLGFVLGVYVSSATVP
jgi:uncharacterized membrane protein SpoIIM required for sporulation